MRKIIPGNRIYTVYHASPQFEKKYMVVAKDNAHARRIVMKKLNPVDNHFSVCWNIYDGNHGITTLPLGTVIDIKLPETSTDS